MTIAVAESEYQAARDFGACFSLLEREENHGSELRCPVGRLTAGETGFFRNRGQRRVASLPGETRGAGAPDGLIVAADKAPYRANGEGRTASRPGNRG